MNNPLYIGFSRTVHGNIFKRLLADGIRWITDSYVNHAFLLYKEPHFGTWVTLGANINGVGEISLKLFTQSRHVIDIFYPATNPDGLWRGLTKLSYDIGKHYNIGGLIGMVPVEIATHWFHIKNIPNVLNNPDELFCSEFVADVINAAGLNVESLKNISPDEIDPGALDFALLKDPKWDRLSQEEFDKLIREV